MNVCCGCCVLVDAVFVGLVENTNIILRVSNQFNLMFCSSVCTVREVSGNKYDNR